MTKLKAVMFCEFDPHLGPQIAFQKPDHFISKEQMDEIAAYIIPKPQLQRLLISYKAFNFLFMGYPVVIEDKKYHRNALMFNMVFVFDENDDVSEYEPVVKKLAGYLITLEHETLYLSDENKKIQIPNILQNILTDLNSSGECIICIDSCNTIHLKITHLLKTNPEVSDYDVPVLIWSRSLIESHHWDLTAKRILPSINGNNHVQKIASICDIDLGLVRSAIQTLFFHGVVTVLPLFAYSNMYAIKPEFGKLTKDTELKDECLRFVATDETLLPKFRDVFMLYCALGPGISVTALCSRHDPSSLGVDEQRLIQFGLIKKFVRQIKKYPVSLTSDKSSIKWKGHSKFLNGYHDYSEICCKSAASGENITFQDIDRMTENDPYVVHIWK